MEDLLLLSSAPITPKELATFLTSQPVERVEEFGSSVQVFQDSDCWWDWYFLGEDDYGDFEPDQLEVLEKAGPSTVLSISFRVVCLEPLKKILGAVLERYGGHIYYEGPETTYFVARDSLSSLQVDL